MYKWVKTCWECLNNSLKSATTAPEPSTVSQDEKNTLLLARPRTCIFELVEEDLSMNGVVFTDAFDGADTTNCMILTEKQ
jgi:hypothetical protein